MYKGVLYRGQKLYLSKTQAITAFAAHWEGLSYIGEAGEIIGTLAEQEQFVSASAV